MRDLEGGPGTAAALPSSPAAGVCGHGFEADCGAPARGRPASPIMDATSGVPFPVVKLYVPALPATPL